MKSVIAPVLPEVAVLAKGKSQFCRLCVRTATSRTRRDRRSDEKRDRVPFNTAPDLRPIPATALLIVLLVAALALPPQLEWV
jgi:hypothetical protein